MLSVVLAVGTPLLAAGLHAVMAADPTLRLSVLATGGQLDDAASIDLGDHDAAVVDEQTALRVGRSLVGQLRLVVVLERAGSDVLQLLAAGASGILAYGSDGRVVITAVHAVCAGSIVLDPGLVDALKGPRLPPLSGPDAVRAEELTGREAEVLRCLGRGMTNAEIGGELYVSEDTVKTHVSRVLRKLGLRDRLQAGLYAIRMAPSARP